MAADDATPLTFAEALAMLPDGDQVRVIRDGQPASWERDNVVRLLATTSQREAGPEGRMLAARLADGTWAIIEIRNEKEAPGGQ